MSNINAKSINVGRLNVTENFIYHRGKKTKMLDVDASGNLCLTNSIFSNEPFKLGINICPGTTVTDGSANQILNAALDISGGLQLAFNDVTTMPTTNNLGSVSFFKDGSGNYIRDCYAGSLQATNCIFQNNTKSVIGFGSSYCNVN